jgi:hypothetical protein
MSPLPWLALYSELRNPTAVRRGPHDVAANAASDDAEAGSTARRGRNQTTKQFLFS